MLADARLRHPRNLGLEPTPHCSGTDTLEVGPSVVRHLMFTRNVGLCRHDLVIHVNAEVFALCFRQISSQFQRSAVTWRTVKERLKKLVGQSHSFAPGGCEDVKGNSTPIGALTNVKVVTGGRLVSRYIEVVMTVEKILRTLGCFNQCFHHCGCVHDAVNTLLVDIEPLQICGYVVVRQTTRLGAGHEWVNVYSWLS